MNDKHSGLGQLAVALIENPGPDNAAARIVRQRDIGDLPEGTILVTAKDAYEFTGETIRERDDAEEAMSQAYYLVTGRSPEWSNNFGYEQALEDIKDACELLRKAARPSPEERDIDIDDGC